MPLCGVEVSAFAQPLRSTLNWQQHRFAFARPASALDRTRRKHLTPLSTCFSALWSHPTVYMLLESQPIGDSQNEGCKRSHLRRDQSVSFSITVSRSHRITKASATSSMRHIHGKTNHQWCWRCAVPTKTTKARQHGGLASEKATIRTVGASQAVNGNSGGVSFCTKHASIRCQSYTHAAQLHTTQQMATVGAGFGPRAARNKPEKVVNPWFNNDR